MKREQLIVGLYWAVGLLVAFVVGLGIGQSRARTARGEFLAATAAVSPVDKARLEAAPVLAAANVAWALGGVASVKKLASLALDRLPESEGPMRARTFLRVAIVDMNPDGQAALIGYACGADPDACKDLLAATTREVRERFVSPGNTLPLFVIGGHPPIP